MIIKGNVTLAKCGLIALLTAALAACQQTGGDAPADDSDTSAASTSGNAAVVSLRSPPRAPRVKFTRKYHGLTLRDDYAWLQDPGYPNVTNPNILAYLQAENAYFDAWLTPQQAKVDALFAEIKGRQPEADESVPFRRGNYYYQWRFTPGAQYRTWYWAPANAPDSWAVLLDENRLAADKQYFQLGRFAVSPDGRTLAYSADTNGSERYRIYLRDLVSGETYDYRIERTIGGLVWANDSRSFFYVSLDDKWRSNEVWRHRLRAVTGARGDDELVLREIDERYRMSIYASTSRQYLIINSGTHDTDEIRALALDRELVRPRLIVERQDGKRHQVDHRDQYFYIVTNDTHPNFRLVRAPQNNPGQKHWQTVVAPSGSVYLRQVQTFANHIVLQQRENGLDQIRVLDTQHRGHLVQFPESVYTAAIGTNGVYQTETLRLHYESMVTPATVFDYDVEQRRLRTRKVQQIPSGYDANNYVTERFMVTARDGVQVPVSLVRHKDYVADGTAPLWLTGYGAYGLAVPPDFSAARLSMLERGVAFAIAHIRGGNDLGDAWQQGGKLMQRTNTFNDFVDVANDLVGRGYGAPGNVAISGGSAGGTLMGAAVNQAPELWGVVASHVPFVDVLNTMLNDALPLTPPEWREWGNPIEDKAAYEYIQSYSPYDQLSAGTYPPMLVTAGLNDPRVTYWEPAKYVAKLRTLKRGDSLLVLKTNMGAGHAGESGRFTRLKEAAEQYAFFLQHLTGTKEKQ